MYMCTEMRKYSDSDAKCKGLGWCCILLAVETYGAQGPEALQVLSHEA